MSDDFEVAPAGTMQSLAHWRNLYWEAQWHIGMMYESLHEHEEVLLELADEMSQDGAGPQ